MGHMQSLCWCNDQITDSRMALELKKLPQHKTTEFLDTMKNKLESIPKLIGYKQFKILEILDLSRNNIMTPDAENIPCDVRVLEMCED